MNYNSREHTLGTRESIIHDRESVKLNHHSFHYVPGLADCPIVAPDYPMTQTNSSIVLHSNTQYMSSNANQVISLHDIS